MELSNLFGYGLVALGTITFALSPFGIKANQSETQTPSEPMAVSTETDSPRRLTVTVKVQEPQDLKVQEGQEVKKGQVIAARDREKQRLESQRSQLTLSLQKLQSYAPFPPTPPQPVPAVKALPPTSYLEHEQAKLKQLKQKHTAAVRDYQLAVGKLQTAKNQRSYQEYQASLEAARRVEEVNQARSSYERQLAEYQQRLGEREFQVAQVKAKLQEVDNAIASLATVKAPYSGTVRRVKWLGQSSDGSLSAEVTVMVFQRDRSAVRGELK
jgi:multidrug efflux pump subunit AcrA (membrane-fusion protein)